MRPIILRLIVCTLLIVGGGSIPTADSASQKGGVQGKNTAATVDPLDGDLFPDKDVNVASANTIELETAAVKVTPADTATPAPASEAKKDNIPANVMEKFNNADKMVVAQAQTPADSLSPADAAKPSQPIAQSAPQPVVAPAGNPSQSDIDRFEGELRKQKVSDITDTMGIEKEFKNAKSIKLPDPPTKVVPKEEKSVKVTDQEIIQSLIPADLRDQKIDLDFDAVKLNDVFMTLGKAAGINVMLDPTLKEQPTDIHLKQVPIEESFILLSSGYNLGFKKIGNSLFITDKEKLRQENFVTKVFKLRNINAQEAKGMLSSIIKTINVGEEINSLIVVGDTTEVAEVEKVLKTIDVPQPQVILEAKVIELNRDALKDLGVDWSDSINLQYRESGRPVKMQDPEDAGHQWYQITKFQRDAIQFDTTIHMLENQNKAKVLSNPKVATINNKEAEIFVGDRIPYTVTTISGGVATTDVRFEEPGIRLRITPSIIEDDFVVIKVEPEVSFIFSFRGPDDQYPWTKKRQATAYVRVKNGQPFVLGGLLDQEDKKNFYKVPFIGDIPLLGNLFSYQKDTVLDTELIITVTPKIVRGDF